jgi:ABC-2 type transport system permease protein
MKQFLLFVQKEFRHILRDPKSLLIIIALPIVQIIIFGFALTNEIKNANFGVLITESDEATRTLIERMNASAYFDLVMVTDNMEEAEAAFLKDNIKLLLVFQPGFENALLHGHQADIQLIADATDPNTATTLSNYASIIINEYQQELIGETALPYRIQPNTRMLYNPQLIGAYNFVPGVMGMILLLISAMMTSIAIVREKELNTMEVLLASPLKPFVLITSKAVPYVILSLINVSTILLISTTLLDLPIRGNLLLILAECFLFISTAISLGLMISNITDKQQTALFISLMGLMLPTLILSGFMFPIENMPIPLQVISNVVPSKWFFIIIKNVMIKGLGWESVWLQSLILMGMTTIFLSISVLKFKKRLA